MKNSFSHLSDIPGCENSFSVKWKCFFNEFFIPASGNGKSIFLFRVFLKLLKFGGGNSCLWKLIFWLVVLIFSHSSDTPSSESYFLSSGNVFLGQSSDQYGGNAFSVLWKPFSSLINNFFLQVETITEISGKPFLWWEDLIPASRKEFSVQGFSFIKCFFPASQNRYWN